MISVKNLSLRRGDRTIVQNISFNVDAGDLHVVSGPNGSGKSTILAAVAGDLEPERGEIFLHGEPLTLLNDRQQAQRRAVLTQNYVLFPYTGQDLLTLVAKQRAKLGLVAPSMTLDIADLAKKKLTAMSGGEQAQVMLAATLEQGSRTLLLDEPTAAFDREHRHRFAESVQQWRSAGYGILLVTHDERLEAEATSVTRLDTEQ